jgi:UDP-glucose-4-epimerase GalE
MIRAMTKHNHEPVLVTGGAGYVGSHCAKALSQAGYTPVVFDNFSTGHRDFVRWGPVIEGDVRDADALDVAIAQTRPVAVMHFAALSLVGQSVEQPELYREVNCGGTRNLLATMAAHDVTRLVFSSTAAIFGEPDVDLIDETTAKLPGNPYGETKLVCEWMIGVAETEHGIRSACLRYFNAAGADPDGEIGEHHQPETHLIPLILDTALGRRETIQVFGNDYPTPDGTAVRDYIHVADLARAHVAALRHLNDGGNSLALNLGTGQGISVRQVVDAARQVTAAKIQTTDAPRRVGDPPRLVADPGQVGKILDWQARRSDIETIIADAWAWHRRRFDSEDS